MNEVAEDVARMASLRASVGERSLTKRMTVNVVVTVRRSWRVRLGLLLLRGGARLAGLGYRDAGAEGDER